MWQVQGTLHGKNNALVPGALVLVAASLLAYRHMTQEVDDGGDPLKTFLALILCQMLPLVALEMKIMQCADPVGLFCKFAVPVTVLHTIFLAMRMCIYDILDPMLLTFSACAMVGSIVTLVKGFHWSPTQIFHYKSVWFLTILSVLGSILTQSLEMFFAHGTVEFSREHFIRDTLMESNSFLEILAFVPAVRMVFGEDKTAERFQVELLDTQRTASAFFLFLVGFYLTEDVLNSFQAWEVSGLATAAHIVHFLLLLDFACYVLAHIYNPEKLLGALSKWLPMERWHDV